MSCWTLPNDLPLHPPTHPPQYDLLTSASLLLSLSGWVSLARRL